jgi:chromosome partitioning protein
MLTPVIVVANQKGGVGKTTTAINLASCLAERRKRILLVDLDPQANATSGLGLDKKEGMSIYSALLGEGALIDLIQPTSQERLDLIASEVDLAGAEIDIARADRYLHRVQTAMLPLRTADRYDYIFIDCPPSLGVLTMNALTASQGVLIPIQCEYYALEGLSVMVQLVKRLRESGANPELTIEGIVMTMYDGRTNLSQQVVQEVSTHFGNKLFETLIPRSVRLSEAPSHGQSIIAYDKNCTGAAAYRQLAREFLKRRQGYLDDSSAAPRILSKTLAAACEPVAQVDPEPPAVKEERHDHAIMEGESHPSMGDDAPPVS